MTDNTLIITGMLFVTYIPRLLPFFIISEKKLPDRVDRFFALIPYAALGALIIPGVFEATPESPPASVAGILFAVIISWFFKGIMLPVFGSIIITYIFMMTI